ncbi:MAG: HNH endonuclease [Pirellulales bacterium]
MREAPTQTPRRLLRIYLRDEGQCGICKEHVEPEVATLDHIIPRAFNGSDDDSNVQLAHWLCNHAKRDRPPGPPPPPEFAGRLRYFRMKRGLSQRDLAEQADIRRARPPDAGDGYYLYDFTVIRHLEGSYRLPTQDEVRALADALDVKPEELMGDE